MTESHVKNSAHESGSGFPLQVGVVVVAVVVDVTLVAVVVVVVVSVVVVVVVPVVVVSVTVDDVSVTVVVELEVVDVVVVVERVVVEPVVVVVVVSMHVPHITGHRACIKYPTSPLLQYDAFSSWQSTGSGKPLHNGATQVAVPCSMAVTTKFCSTKPLSGKENVKTADNFIKAAATSLCERFGIRSALYDPAGSNVMEATSIINKSELSTIKSLTAADSLV